MFGLLASCADSGKEFSSVQSDIVQSSASFNQSAIKKKVDILFVVDNSTSMVRDQQVIGAQFRNFISNISEADFRIGFINTDVSTPGYENVQGFFGNLRRVGSSGRVYIDSNSPNPSQLFNDAITLQAKAPCPGFTGECHEEPMRAVTMALQKRYTANAGFFRDDATFVSIIITDEDEYSSGGAKALKPAQLVQFLNSANSKGVIDGVSMFVIAIPPTDNDCYQAQRRASVSGNGAYPAGLLWTLQNYIEGFNVSICDPNMGREMARISEYVKTRLLFKSVQLNPPPVSKRNMKVVVRDKFGIELNIKWKLVSGSVITFEPTPPADSSITVTYEKKRND